MMLKKMLFVTLALAAVVLTGCNTVAGAGRDIQDAGHAITNSAETHE